LFNKIVHALKACLYGETHRTSHCMVIAHDYGLMRQEDSPAEGSPSKIVFQHV